MGVGDHDSMKMTNLKSRNDIVNIFALCTEWSGMGEPQVDVILQFWH